MTKARSVLAILLGLFALLTLLDRFVLVELLLRRTGIPLLLAAAMALAMAGIGALVRRAKHINLPLDLLIGYPLFGTLCFLAGLVRVSIWTLAPIAAIGLLLAILFLLRRYSDDAYVAPERPPLHWSAFAVVAVMVCAFVAAQAPPASLD